jgi:4-hydroxybenzoate polyprenyltransferase
MDPDGRRPSALRGLALACHPLPTVGVTILSAGLAALADLGFGRGAAFTGAVLIGQLSIGWSNDWIDAARDRASGRSGKPVAEGAVAPSTVVVSAVVSLVTAIALSMVLGWRAGVATSTQFLAGWAYNLGLKSTVLSWIPYAIGFGMLPAGAVVARPGHPWPSWWAMAAGAVLGLAAHAANVLPDLKADKATGINGVWHHLGARVTAISGPVLLVVASALVLFGPGHPAAWKWGALAAIAAVAWFGLSMGLRNPDSRGLFAASIVLAGIDLALFAASGAALY